MESIKLDRNWKFKHMSGKSEVKEKEGWVAVDLPHDFSIGLARNADAVGGGGNGYFPGGIGLYEKEIEVPAEWMDKTVLIELEGVYMNAVVLINKQLAGRHPYGYSSFHCDLTPYLHVGKNSLRIEANNGGMANTRWYSGSGVYRPVRLLVGGKIRVGPWDVAVTTAEIGKKSAVVQVATLVRNDGPMAVTAAVRSTLSADGRMISSCHGKLEIPAGGSETIRQEILVPDARPWSLDDPFLHRLHSEILREGILVDAMETPFGIRTISVDAVHGFRLNGETLKLRGGCVHHDCGLLGSAAYARAEERKVELLKASGFNAVRCAHNPPSVAFLDACDRMGMLVVDEAFDCFRHGKNPGDYGLSFEDWWQRDLTAMVLRDRNHPSVIIWSTGNEIIERNGWSNGAEWSRTLADHVRSIDPTRPVTNALCDLWEETVPGDTPETIMARWEEATSAFAAPLDIVGYNYLLHRYARDAEQYKGRIICGTETFPHEAFDYWEATERLPYIIGDFVWTSLDYLGEAGLGHERPADFKGNWTLYPWHQANCGDIDICGVKRPQSYYRDCVWGISTAPWIAVHSPEDFDRKLVLSPWGWPDVVASWNWPGQEGKTCAIDVYSTDDEVVLTLNGKEIGRKPAGKANKHMASFEVAYEPGTLEAIGIQSGIECSRILLETAGSPAAIRLTPDRQHLMNGFGDLSYVLVEVVDAKGVRVPTAENLLFFAANGEGSLLAVGNGDPDSEEAYTGNMRRAHRGIATAVVRAEGEPGGIFLTVSAEGLVPASVRLESVCAQEPAGAQNAEGEPK